MPEKSHARQRTSQLLSLQHYITLRLQKKQLRRINISAGAVMKQVQNIPYYEKRTRINCRHVRQLTPAVNPFTHSHTRTVGGTGVNSQAQQVEHDNASIPP